METVKVKGRDVLDLLENRISEIKANFNGKKINLSKEDIIIKESTKHAIELGKAFGLSIDAANKALKNS